MKVYVVRKYNKLTRWDCNHSTTFEEFEFPTKAKRWNFETITKRAFSTFTRKLKVAKKLERRGTCELKRDTDI